MSKIQVAPNHYADLHYDNKKRFISYWHQISEVVNTEAEQILEIGLGNGFLANYLKDHGFNVTTVDIDKRLNPDVVGSVLELPFDDGEFDLVTCYEVLEHIPYKNVGKALDELYRVSSKNVIISIPDRTLTYKLLLKLPILKEISFLFNIPKLLAKKHHFDGQHYWELGKKGYPVSAFKEKLKEHGFEISDSYQIFEVHSHHFFLLTK